MDPLFRKAMRDLRGQTIWWGVGLAFLLGITVALFPSVSDIYSDFRPSVDLSRYNGFSKSISK